MKNSLVILREDNKDGVAVAHLQNLLGLPRPRQSTEPRGLGKPRSLNVFYTLSAATVRQSIHLSTQLCITCPPSIFSVCPVRFFPYSLARNTAIAPNSSVSCQRPRGEMRLIFSPAHSS
jgi:hypothetical protein